MGKNSNAGVIVIVLIGLFAFFYILQTPAGNTQSITGAGDGTGQTAGTIVTTSICGDDQLADFESRFSNGLATGAEYSVVTIYYVDEAGKIIASDATNAAGTFESVSNALACGKSYRAVTLNDASFVAAMVGPELVDGAKEQFDVVGANSSEVQFQVFTLAYGNETPSGTWSQDVTTGTANAMDAGSTLDLRFDVQAASAGAQFGSLAPLTESGTGVSGQAFVCADFNLAKYNKQDVALAYSGIVRELSTLPRYCAANSYEKAWEVKAITAAAGTQSGTIHIASNVGAPGATDDVKFIWVDMHYYRGADGTLKAGTADDSNSDVGETNRYFTVNVA